MAHIDLGVDEKQFPGISGPMRYRPETAKPLNELAEVLLRAPHSLPAGERELIAAYVSGRNESTEQDLPPDDHIAGSKPVRRRLRVPVHDHDGYPTNETRVIA